MPPAPTPIFYKDPNDKLNYGVDWSTWLDSGDTIATSEWEVPSPLVNEDESNTTTTTAILLSGGVPGGQYNVRNRITTALGYIKDQTLLMIVREN